MHVYFKRPGWLFVQIFASAMAHRRASNLSASQPVAGSTIDTAFPLPKIFECWVVSRELFRERNHGAASSRIYGLPTGIFPSELQSSLVHSRASFFRLTSHTCVIFPGLSTVSRFFTFSRKRAWTYQQQYQRIGERNKESAAGGKRWAGPPQIHFERVLLSAKGFWSFFKRFEI